MASSTPPDSSNKKVQTDLLKVSNLKYDVQTSFNAMDKGIFLLSSSALYFAEMLATHPLEVLRASIQVSQKSSSMEIIRDRISQSGLKSLYAGFWPATFGHLPGNTVYLFTYTYLKDVLQKKENARHQNRAPDGSQAAWVSFTSAAAADLAAVGLYCPVDVVVQRLFLQSSTKPQYTGYRDVFETILRTEGVRGFYRGVGPILVNSLPASAVWWTIYEECKTLFAATIANWSSTGGAKQDEEKDGFQQKVVHKHAGATMAAGAIAGGVVTYMTNPLDVVRTRLQTQSMKVQAYQYTTAWSTLKEIIKTEGSRALFKGATPRLAEWVVFSAASAFAYEFIVDLSATK